MPSDWRGRPPLVWVLLVVAGILGVRAILGGGQFILVPSGEVVGVSPSVLAGSPFRDFRIPGFVLFVVLGAFPLVVALGIHRGRPWAWWGTLAVALALAGWAIAEGMVIGFGERLQYLNLLQAIAMFVLALVPSVREHLRGGRGEGE